MWQLLIPAWWLRQFSAPSPRLDLASALPPASACVLCSVPRDQALIRRCRRLGKTLCSRCRRRRVVLLAREWLMSSGPSAVHPLQGSVRLHVDKGSLVCAGGLTHIVILISPFNLSSLCSAPSFGEPSGLLFQAASFQKPKPSPGSLPLFVIYLWGGWGTCLRKEREWGLIFP